MAEYYNLVAGLRELAFDGKYKDFSAYEIATQIAGELTKKDLARLRLLYNSYDIENIINIRNNRSKFSNLGVFTREQLERELHKPEHLPKYIATVTESFKNPDNVDYEDVELNERFEHALYEAYYAECAGSRCRFLQQWAEFDRNLRNLMAAYTARTWSMPMGVVVVGDDFITDHLKRNSALDFGLKGELDYIDTVISAISDEPNLIEKERKIDALRWGMADELTEFDYFDINTILAYLVKANIIHRWMALDEDEGRAVFGKLTAAMSAKDIIEQAENRRS